MTTENPSKCIFLKYDDPYQGTCKVKYNSIRDFLDDVQSDKPDSPYLENPVTICSINNHDILAYIRKIYKSDEKAAEAVYIKDLVPVFQAFDDYGIERNIIIRFNSEKDKIAYRYLNDLLLMGNSLSVIMTVDELLRHVAACRYNIPDTTSFTIDYVHKRLIQIRHITVDIKEHTLAYHMDDLDIKDQDILSITPRETGYLYIEYYRYLCLEQNLTEYLKQKQLLDNYGIQIHWKTGNHITTTAVPHKAPNIQTYDIQADRTYDLKTWLRHILRKESDKNLELMISEGILHRPIGYYWTDELRIQIPPELKDRQDRTVTSVTEHIQNNACAYVITIDYDDINDHAENNYPGDIVQ